MADNPHHASYLQALEEGSDVGVVKLLRHALKGPLAERGVGLDAISVSSRIEMPEGLGVVQRLKAQVFTEFEEAEIIIDLPYVSNTGAIVHKARDIAPIAFLRLGVGAWHVGEPVVNLHELAELLLFDAAAAALLHDLEDDLDVPTPFSSAVDTLSTQMALLESDRQDPQITTTLIYVPKVDDPITIGLAAGRPLTVSVPGRGVASLDAVRDALERLAARDEDPKSTTRVAIERSLGRAAVRIAEHVRRVEGRSFEDVTAEDLLRGLDVPAERTFADAISLYEDLDNCRLLLAGHHLADVVDQGARRAARDLPEKVEFGQLKVVADTVVKTINELIDRLVLGSLRHPDGGSAPFEAIDDTNPLARFEHCRKVSRLGPGGVHPKSRLAMALRDVHPSQLGRLCPFNTPESDRVGLVRHLTLDAEVLPDGTFGAVDELAALSRTKLLSASALLLPLLDHDDAVRGVLAAKSIRQFVPLSDPELPLVATGDEAEVSGRLMLAVRAAGGTAEVTSDGVFVERSPQGDLLAELPLRTHPGSVPTAGTDDARRPCFDTETGRIHLAKGDLALRSPGTTVVQDEEDRARYAVLAPGVNVRCAVMPFEGLTLEDAVVVSESLAERMRSPHLERVVELYAPDEVVVTNLRRLQGRKVSAGDVLLRVEAACREDDGEAGSDADGLFRREVRSPHSGVVAEVHLHRVTREIRLLIRVERPLSVGDKVIARHGNKGIVSAVLPDGEMPLIEEFAGPGTKAERADLVISPFGPLRRMVIGLLHELAWGRAGWAGAEVPDLPAIDHHGTDDVAAVVGHAGGVGWTATVVLPGGGRREGIAVGVSYLMKLNHLADRKLQAQDWTFTSVLTGQPAAVRVDEGGRQRGRPGRLGEMEHWALQAHRADALLRDANGPRRGSSSAMPASLWAVLDNLHAAAMVATLVFVNPKTNKRFEVGDSREYVAVLTAAQHQGVYLAELTIDLAERRRLQAAASAGEDLPAGGAPAPLLELEDPFAAVQADRRGAAAASPRPPDNRKRVENADRQVLDGWGWLNDEKVLACRCGSSNQAAKPSTVCQTCRRQRKRTPGLAAQHHIAFIDLRTPVVHPWCRGWFWTAVAGLAACDDHTGSWLRKLAPDADPAGAERAAIERCIAVVAEDRGPDDPARSAALRVLEWTISYLPLLPPAHRRATVASAGVAVQHRLSRRYRAVWDAALAVRRTPHRYDRLRSAVVEVFGFAEGDAAEHTLAARLRYKEGLLRRYLLGGREWNTGYAVIAPGLDLRLDEVGLPAAIMEELHLSDGDLVLVNRSPTLLRTGMLGMQARRVEGAVVRLPPAVLPMLAGDFDGDMVSIHRPETADGREELRTLLHPAVNLRSPADGALLVQLGEELKIDEGVAASIASQAEVVHQAFVDGDLDAVDREAGKLRDIYRDGYDLVTGRGSVSLAHLIDPDLDPDVLDEAMRAGFGAALQEQCTTQVGSTDTYASRRGAEGPAQVDGCFRDGLGRSAMLANVRGAMTRLGDKKLATPFAGDFTKVLVEALYGVRVTEDDCGSEVRVPLSALSVLADRRVVDGDVDGQPAVRSPLTCALTSADPTQVCAACYGSDVGSGVAPPRGARVGLLAATAIGERGTQLALKSIHVGARQTQLDELRRSVTSVGAVPVPEQGDDGSLRLEGDGSDREAKLVDDPVAVMQRLRWFLTPEPSRRAPRSRPGVDDVHLELLVASLASAARGTKRSPLGAAVAAHDFLARCTVRGQLDPLVAALGRDRQGRTATVSDPRTAIIFAPGVLA